jgi:hypothetical protein
LHGVTTTRRTYLVTLTMAILGPSVLLVPVPARASLQPGAFVPVPSTASIPDCAQLPELVSNVRRSTGHAAVNCLRSVESTDVTAQAACGSNGWNYTRRSACGTGLGTLFIIHRPSGAILGGIDYSIETNIVLNARSDRWLHVLTYRASFAWGATAGVTITIRPDCGTACRFISGAGRTASALPSSTPVGGNATFATTYAGLNQVWRASSAWTSWFTTPNTQPTQTPPTTLTAPEFRCDDTLGPSTSVGCVYPNVQPVHEIGRLRYPKYARHIELAISHDVGSVLTRTTDPVRVAANAAIACPEGSAYPRPAGQSCDEYPFRSTREGAASQSFGRTFLIINWQTGDPPFVCSVPWLPRRLGERGGYSVCMVPIAENSGGGTDLGLFYYDNRIIDGDRFEVRIV